MVFRALEAVISRLVFCLFLPKLAGLTLTRLEELYGISQIDSPSKQAPIDAVVPCP